MRNRSLVSLREPACLVPILRLRYLSGRGQLRLEDRLLLEITAPKDRNVCCAEMPYRMNSKLSVAQANLNHIGVDSKLIEVARKDRGVTKMHSTRPEHR